MPNLIEYHQNKRCWLDGWFQNIFGYINVKEIVSECHRIPSGCLTWWPRFHKKEFGCMGIIEQISEYHTNHRWYHSIYSKCHSIDSWCGIMRRKHLRTQFDINKQKQEICINFHFINTFSLHIFIVSWQYYIIQCIPPIYASDIIDIQSIGPCRDSIVPFAPTSLIRRLN